MPDPLAARLRLLKQALRSREPPAAAPPPAAGQGEAAAEAAALGLASWERVGELTYRRVLLCASPLEDAEISEHLVSGGLSVRDLLFFDTETTGLSGGAGTLIFLIALGWIEGDQLTVEQLFLADYPGEPDFLERLHPSLEGGRQLVSYNGLSFDAPLLRTRFALNRRSLTLPRQHSDLLFWARRLWKRELADCSLGNIEREVLGLERVADVAGYEVPAVYLEYLRHGWSPRLPLVWEHNLQDVRSLARLFSLVNRILTRQEAPARTDLGSLGRYLATSGGIASGGLARGLELLRQSFAAGDERAGRTLSLHLKRAGRWEEAVAVWRELLERGRSLFAAVELAKHAEHRLKDAPAALGLVGRIRSWNLPLDARARRELAARQARLERKAQSRK
jgi:hypothetical protein